MVRKRPEEEDDSKDELLVAIGEQIKILRIARGWTQRQLGDFVGMTSASIYLIEKGSQNSTITTLRRIATALGVSVGTLLPDEQRGIGLSSELLNDWCDATEKLANNLRGRLNEAADDIDKAVRLYRDLIGKRGAMLE